MRQKVESWRIVANGTAVGVGLAAAAIAILMQFSIGQDFIQTIRRATEGTLPSSEAQSQFYAPVQASPRPTRAPTFLNGNPLPASVTTIESVSVTTGQTRTVLPPGQTLTVSGIKDTFFYCDYLGDIIAVPIISTDWSGSNPSDSP